MVLTKLADVYLRIKNFDKTMSLLLGLLDKCKLQEDTSAQF